MCDRFNSSPYVPERCCCRLENVRRGCDVCDVCEQRRRRAVALAESTPPLQRRSKSLSATILDYYTRYGHNRDLEKYFRYRKYNTGSSDESSSLAAAAVEAPLMAAPTLMDAKNDATDDDIEVLDEQYPKERTTERVRERQRGAVRQQALFSRSADDLDKTAGAINGTSAEQTETTEKTEQNESSNESPSTPKHQPKPTSSRSENDLTDRKSHKKSTSSGAQRKPTASRSLYSLTSNIEIKITKREKHRTPSTEATTAAAPETQTWKATATQTGIATRHQKPLLADASLETASADSKSTQTAVLPDTPKAVTFSGKRIVHDAADALDETEPPDANTSFNSIGTARPSSTNSSIVSMVTAAANKPRLEWDSLADVGYEKACQTDTERAIGGDVDGNAAAGGQSGGAGGVLSPFERATLQKFFAQRGVSCENDDLLAALEDPKLALVDDGGGGKNESVREVVHDARVGTSAKVENTLTEMNPEADQTIDTTLQPTTATTVTTLTASNSALGRLFACADAASTPIVDRSARFEHRSAQTLATEMRSTSVQLDPQPVQIETRLDSLHPVGVQMVADNVAEEVFVAREVPDEIVAAESEASFQFIAGPWENVKNLEPSSENIVSIEPREISNGQILEKTELFRKTNSNESTSTSVDRRKNTDSKPDVSHLYDAHTDEIVRTILCSTTSDQSSSAVLPNNSTLSSSGVSAKSTTMMQDLQRGIELLDKLVESERLDKSTKKRLVKKIVNGLLRAKYNISSGSSSFGGDSTVGSSVSRAMSYANGRNVAQHIAEAVATNRGNDTGAGLSVDKSPKHDRRPASDAQRPMQWLKPLTRSEREYEEQKQRKIQNRNIHQQQQQQREPIATKESVKLQWIQQEIAHLVRLQDFLVHKQSNTVDNRLYENTTATTAADANIRHHLPPTTSTENYYCEVADSKTPRRRVYNYSTSTYASTKNSRTNDACPLTSAATDPLDVMSHRQSPAAAQRPSRRDDSSDSPLLLLQQRYVRNRNKLRTPCDLRVDDEPRDRAVRQHRHHMLDDHEDALAAYARSKQRAFLKRYATPTTPNDVAPASSPDAEPLRHDRDLIYANPYGEFRRHARHAVAPRTVSVGCGSGSIASGRLSRHRIVEPRSCPSADSSGNTFVSSNSVSIPELRSSSYPDAFVTESIGQQTRQRHRSASVAIQTGDSLLKPILKQLRDGNDAEQHRRPSSDRRYSRTTSSKPLPAVSYTITFHANEKSAKPELEPQPTPVVADPPTMVSNDSNQTVRHDETAQPTMSVQEYLHSRRPRFLIAANRRRECVLEMNAMRRRRNAQRQELFQQQQQRLDVDNDCDEVAELCRRLRELDPPPLAQRRCFSTRELLTATRRRCRRLPEVCARTAAERTARVRRAQRHVRDVFNRELQRRALRGHVNLSNSLMLVAGS